MRRHPPLTQQADAFSLHLRLLLSLLHHPLTLSSSLRSAGLRSLCAVCVHLPGTQQPRLARTRLWRSPSIRYANVATVYLPEQPHPHPSTWKLTSTTAYAPYDSSLNTLSGSFARINLACGAGGAANSVGLRVTMRISCASATSCSAPATKLPGSERVACYRSGCACYGTTVTTTADCEGTSADAKEGGVLLPADGLQDRVATRGMVSMTVYDFDTGPSGDYVEQLTVPTYEYCDPPAPVVRRSHLLHGAR